MLYYYLNKEYNSNLTSPTAVSIFQSNSHQIWSELSFHVLIKQIIKKKTSVNDRFSALSAKFVWRYCIAAIIDSVRFDIQR